MLIVLVSAKGAPGVTVATVAFAAAWPARWQAAILECDPSGGDLAAAFGLNAEPGLLTLASAVRRDHRAGLLWEHLQELPGGLPVVPAPASAEQATAAIDVLMASPGLEAFHRLGSEPAGADGGPTGAAARPSRARVVEAVDEGVVLVDAGRLPAHLSQGAGASRLLSVADVVLVVAANQQAGIVHAAARLDALRSAAGGAEGRVRMVLVGSEAYSASEVALALGVPVAGTLPVDERAAAILLGRPARKAEDLGRLPLLRAAGAIGRQLAAEYRWANAVDPEPDTLERVTAFPGESRSRARAGGDSSLREGAR